MGEALKTASVMPRPDLAEISFETEEGTQEVFTGFITDLEEPNSLKATRYYTDPETLETIVERGRIKGLITETKEFMWEHRKGAAVVATLAISVAFKTLRVKHRD